MRDDARAGAELTQELRTQAKVELAGKIERHHGRRAQIRLEEILLNEANALSQTGPLGRARALGHHPRIDLDAHPPCAEITRGGDDDPAVARSQVIDDVVPAHARES